MPEAYHAVAKIPNAAKANNADRVRTRVVGKRILYSDWQIIDAVSPA